MGFQVSRPLATVFLLAAVACAAPDRPIRAGLHIGEPLENREVLAFSPVRSNPLPYLEQTLLVEATVNAVCQNKGCWMQVGDGNQTAMVRWEAGCGGKYTFPKDAMGERVLIQGSFYPKAISPEDAEHLQEEFGGALRVPEQTYEFNASAVVMLDRRAP